MNDRRTSIRAFFLYALLAVPLTYPLLFSFNTRLLGDGDSWLYIWNMWWLRESVTQGHSFFCTDFVYFPLGECLYVHSWVLLLAAIALPLQGLFSLIALSNLFAYLSFVLAGWGCFRLARLLGLTTTASFIAGLAFTFSPYHYAHAQGHLNLISYQWLPFFLHAVVSAAREGWKPKRVVAASIWLLATALTGWYYLVFALFSLGAINVFHWILRRPSPIRFLAGSLASAALCGVILLPLLIPMVQALDNIPPQPVSGLYSADLQSFLIPGPASGFREWVQAWTSNWIANTAEIGTFVPWTLLGLAGWALWRLPGRERICAALWVGGFFILSLGPHLQFGGSTFDSVLLPYGWLEQLPFFGILRAPIRFHLLTLLGLCLLYGRALQGLAPRRRALPVILAAILLVETFSLPLNTSTPDVSPFYRQLAESDGEGALIDLHYSSRMLYYQTIHRQKLLGRSTLSSRPSRRNLDYLRRTETIRELLAEADILAFGNGRPGRDVISGLPSRAAKTLVLLGHAQEGGAWEVETDGPHRLWIGERLVESETGLSRFEVGEGGEALSIRTSYLPGRSSFPRLSINGRRLDLSLRDAALRPSIKIAKQLERGISWLFYRRIDAPGVGGEEAVRGLRERGFDWIVVPFYGNDFFVRRRLGLSPVYEDRWLAAYSLAAQDGGDSKKWPR